MEQTSPIPEPSAGVPKPAMSLTARLFNVFIEPGEVFEDIKASKPAVANWLVPAVILAIAGMLSVFVIFSQPAIIQQIRDQQTSAMDQQVKAGKMTQAQADQALAMMDKFAGPGMMTLFGSVGAVIGAFIHIFWWAFILWLMGQWFLKIKFPFIKAVEIAGLTTMILVLGAVVSVLMTVIMGKLGMTLSLALLVDQIDFKNKTHMLLAAVNVFNFWQVAVAACGLARVTGAPFTKTLLLVGLYWLAFSLFFIVIGFGQMAM